MLVVNRKCCSIIEGAKKDQGVGHLPYQFEMVMKSKWEGDETPGEKVLLYLTCKRKNGMFKVMEVPKQIVMMSITKSRIKPN